MVGRIDVKLYFNENRSTRIKKALYGDVTGKIKTFAILTAENPGKKQYTAEENNKRTERLKTILKQGGIQYTPIQGFYERKEHSFICFNLSYTEAERLCKLRLDDPIEEWQESFFYGKVFKDGAEISYYRLYGDHYKLIETSSRIDSSTEFDEFFSRFHNFKFSIWMKIFNEDLLENLLEVYDYEALERSLIDGGNGIDRLYYRRKAYRSEEDE